MEGTEDNKSKKREKQFSSVDRSVSNFKTSASLLFFLKQKITDTFLFETLGNTNYNKGTLSFLEIKENLLEHWTTTFWSDLRSPMQGLYHYRKYFPSFTIKIHF